MPTGQLIYPKADHSTQWYNDPKWGGVTMPMDHVKWVQHTTESAGGWPTYDRGQGAGEVCPTHTYEPSRHQWRQHLPINHSARALVNYGENYTNRCDVVQTEISCYCDPNLAKQHGHFVEDLDQQAIEDLAEFAAWLHTEWGLAIDFAPTSINWPAYNGRQPFARMAWDDYRDFSGILGHIAVPGNEHLDPGSLDNRAIEVAISKILGQQQGGGGQGEGGGSDPFGTIALTASIGGHHNAGVHVSDLYASLLKAHPNFSEWAALEARHLARQAEERDDHARAYHLSHQEG